MRSTLKDMAYSTVIYSSICAVSMYKRSNLLTSSIARASVQGATQHASGDCET